MATHFTLGSARCPHSIQQGQSNAQNHVTTVFCDGILPDDQAPTTELEKICMNLRNGNIEGVEGVPANFTCNGPITASNLMDKSVCTVTTGFNENHGKVEVFDAIDTNKDGLIDREEFNASM